MILIISHILSMQAQRKSLQTKKSRAFGKCLLTVGKNSYIKDIRLKCMNSYSIKNQCENVIVKDFGFI